MSTTKVTYFDLTALGEAIRFLLSYGGIDFEDIIFVVTYFDITALGEAIRFLLSYGGIDFEDIILVVTYFDITALGEAIRFLLSYGGIDFEDIILVVTYFDLTALGEAIRFLLSYGGIDFEDIRVCHDEEWPSLKPNTPFGKLPVFEQNGKTAHQHLAICRYLAKQVKLVGKDDWEDLEIDAAVDTFSDVRDKVGRYHCEEDANAKEAQKEILFKEFLPFYLERLDAQAKKNNGYLALGRLTWADLYFVAFLDFMDFMTKIDTLSNYPNLVAVKKNVLKIPSIQAWMEKRPKGNP